MEAAVSEDFSLGLVFQGSLRYMLKDEEIFYFGNNQSFINCI